MVREIREKGGCVDERDRENLGRVLVVLRREICWLSLLGVFER